MSAASDSSFGKRIFDVSVAEIEAVAEPDGEGNNFWREAMASICINRPTLPISAT